MWLWETGVRDKIGEDEEDESNESELNARVAAYLVWTAVSSVVEQVTSRLTAAALTDHREGRMFVSVHDSLWCLYVVLSCSEG